MSIKIKSSDWYERWSYSELLNRAQKIHGSALIIHQAYTGKTLPADAVGAIDKLSSHSIGALGGPSKPGVTCYHCDQKGHVVNECPLYQKAIDRVRKDPGKFHLQVIPKTGGPPTTGSGGGPAAGQTPNQTGGPNQGNRRPWFNKKNGNNKQQRPQHQKKHVNAINETEDSQDEQSEN